MKLCILLWKGVCDACYQNKISCFDFLAPACAVGNVFYCRSGGAGYSDYISEGYEVAALHYLMKPVKEEKLCSVLDRAAEKLSKNEKVLIFEIGGEMVRVPIYQIRYADVFGNYVTIHALSDVTVKMTLGELEKQLDERFYRVGRSTIINLTQISRVTKTEIKLSDGTAIPLPRGAYDGINRAIINMR